MPPKVTTTLVPLNAGPSESSETVQTTFTPTINRVDKACIESFKATVTTHQIGDWVIRESSQPFQHETKPPVISVPKINPKDFSKMNKKSSSNVKQWSVSRTRKESKVFIENRCKESPMDRNENKISIVLIIFFSVDLDQ